MRIGYLIPEFPGQTHAFFWRDRQALADLGVSTVLVSTRRPPPGIIAHEWATLAEQETEYLVPFSVRDAVQSALEALWAGPAGWWRCLVRLARAEVRRPVDRLRLLALGFAAARLLSIGRRRGFDHVHVQSCADAANVALLAYALGRLRYSLSLHGPTLEGYGPNQRAKWSEARFAIVVSRLLEERVTHVLAGSLPPRLRRASMGVDLSVTRRRRPYRPWRPGEPCRLFSCGRLNRVKGYDNLVAAARRLMERGLEIQVRIAGEDESGGHGYHRDLEALIAAAGMTPAVTLLGVLSEERVRAEIESAHVFVLASRDEGIPVAVMEAMAMEAPVVATDVGGTGELVEDGVNGLLVAPQRVDELAEAIERVLRDPALAERLGHSARLTVARDYDFRRGARVLARLLADQADADPAP